MSKSRWTKLLTAALCLGVTTGSATIVLAQTEIIGGNYPNQCYYDCGGCGGDCLGKDYICCKQ